MRFSLLSAGLLSALLALVTWSMPARAQLPFDATALMQQVSEAFNKLAQEMLADKRVANLQEQGLLIAPFLSNIPDAEEGDQMMIFINNWVMEKVMTAMIQQDQDAHFGVIDRVMLEKYLKETKLDQKALCDPINWPPIGKALDAKYMLTGSYSILPVSEKPIELIISVTARIVNLDTARAITAGTFDISYKQTEPADAH